MSIVATIMNSATGQPIQKMTFERMPKPWVSLHLANGEKVTADRVAVGKPARLVPCPEPLLRLLLKWSGRAEAGDSLIASMEVDMSKALASGWQPELSQPAGLRLAVEASGYD